MKEPNPLEYLEGMIRRFKGLTKEEMIEKYNRLAKDWGADRREIAKTAMKKLLSGEIPNEIIKPKSIEEEFKGFMNTPVKVVEEKITENEKLDNEIEKSISKDDELMDASELDTKIPTPPPARKPGKKSKAAKK